MILMHLPKAIIQPIFAERLFTPIQNRPCVKLCIYLQSSAPEGCSYQAFSSFLRHGHKTLVLVGV